MISIPICVCLFLQVYSLQAREPPKLASPKAKHSQNVGSKFKLLCNVEMGAKPLHFEWHFNGQPLIGGRDGHHFRIETSEDDSTLIIAKLSQNHSGNYSCLASNGLGSDSFVTSLLVKGLDNFDSVSTCGASASLLAISPFEFKVVGSVLWGFWLGILPVHVQHLAKCCRFNSDSS